MFTKPNDEAATMTDLCPSCREPLDYPSGDGCAAMTMHQPVQGMVMSAAFWAAVREKLNG
jgi:LSD1 subclass zinc finger protein